MALEIKSNQYIPYGGLSGNGLSKTYYYLVDLNKKGSSKYLSKTGKWKRDIYDIKYDAFYSESEAENFLKRYEENMKAEQKSIPEAYGKPKKQSGIDYAKEIATKTGTRVDAIKKWLEMNEIDALTILQGIGSGKINKQDLVQALMYDEATLEFLRKYNSDGKWSSVWKGTEKPTKSESLREIVKRIIKEELESLQAKEGNIWITFNSHRGWDKAKRMFDIDQKNNVTSMRYNNQWQQVPIAKYEEMKKSIKGVMGKGKLQGTIDHWLNVWR